MPEDIQEHMHALIVQHGSALATLATLWQQPKAQQNDEQTNFLEHGEMDRICGFCNAKMWIKERLAKSSNNNPQFFFCCENGKILLSSLPTTPQKLEVFLTSKERNVVKFRDEICMFNSVLAFTSLGAKVDELVTRGIRPYSFRIQGELYHKIRSTVCTTIHS